MKHECNEIKNWYNNNIDVLCRMLDENLQNYERQYVKCCGVYLEDKKYITLIYYKSENIGGSIILPIPKEFIRERKLKRILK